MTDKMLELVARRFRTLGEPFRLRILQELESGEKAVSRLEAPTDTVRRRIARSKTRGYIDPVRHQRPHGVQAL